MNILFFYRVPLEPLKTNPSINKSGWQHSVYIICFNTVYNSLDNYPELGNKAIIKNIEDNYKGIFKWTTL